MGTRRSYWRGGVANPGEKMGESANRRPSSEVQSSKDAHHRTEKADETGLSVTKSLSVKSKGDVGRGGEFEGFSVRLPTGTREALRFAGAGMELGGSSIACAAIGYGIDLYFHNTTLFATALGAIFGFAGGLYRFIRLALAASQPSGPAEKRSDNY